jgi:hypothetical protein
MPVICGLYEIGIINRFRDYDDLDTYATKSGVEGLLIGKDASDFMAFFGCEIRNPFEGSCFRMGMILDNNRGEPVLCSVHGNASIAIGMNSAVVVVDVAAVALCSQFALIRSSITYCAIRKCWLQFMSLERVS